MNLTDYHAKYFAYELTKRNASDSVDKLAGALADAQVDLNPHQIEAALFAFRNPFSRGAILADEVGLGKTIEAGLLLSQQWAERKRKMLVIVPANLRKQWSQELADKFHLPSVILENRTFNEAIKQGNLNPFVQESVVLCYDSQVERDFARRLDQRSDIRLFLKLPRWFEVETPVGAYNPDWAIVKHDDETVYLVRETKGTKDFLKLRTTEADKVRCGEKHFEALGIPFAVAVSADEV